VRSEFSAETMVEGGLAAYREALAKRPGRAKAGAIHITNF
jgi:hypothetical protein